MIKNSNRPFDRFKEISLLFVIVTLATSLRLYKLGDWSLWIDEAFTIHDALHNQFGTKPINYLFVKFFLSNYGVSELTARIGPALVGILSIVVAYYFFKQVFDQKTALLGSLFLSLSSWHIYWSQNARHYSLLLLFAILCLWFFYAGFESDRPVFIVLSLIFLGLGVLTHPSIIFLSPALVGYLVLVFLLKYERSQGYNLRNLLLFLVPVGVAGLSCAPRYKKIFDMFAATSESGSPLHVLKTTAYYVEIPFLVLTSVMVIYLFTQKDRRGIFLGMAGFVPLMILTIISSLARASSLYIYYTLPIYCLLTAYFITHATKRSSIGINIIALGIFLSLAMTQLSHVYFYFTYQHGDRPRWKEAAQFLMTHCKPEDVLISTAPSVLEYYYFQSDSEVPLPDFNLRKPRQVSWLSEKKIIEGIIGKSRIWFVTNIDFAEIDCLSVHSKGWMAEKLVVVRDFPSWTAGKNRTVKIYYYDTSSKNIKS